MRKFFHLLSVTGILICVLFINTASAQWVAQNSGVTGRLVASKALSDDVVWVGGNSGAVLLTTDGGTTWVNHPIPDANLRITSLEAFDTKNVIAVGINTVNSLGFFIYRTTDGGANWAKLYDAPKSFGDAVRFFDRDNGIAVGDADSDRLYYWNILLTSDGGATWTRLDSAKIPAAHGDLTEEGVSNGMDVIGNHVWFCTIPPSSTDKTFVPRVYHSADKGKTWTATSVTSLNYIQGIAFADEKIGYAMELDGRFSKTTDGGATWKAMSAITTTPLRAIKYRQASNDIFIVGNAGSAFISQNDGISWEQQAPIITVAFRGMTVSPASNIVWAVADNGIILKWDENANDVKLDGAIPLDFDLSQNYPNPFNPSTTIKYSVPKESKVSLKVFDALGKEIVSLVNETKPAGSYQAVFDGANLSSGVYFCRLQAGNVVLSKKLALVK